MNVDIEKLLIDDEQAEQLAYGVFNDIGEYLKENKKEFMEWFTFEIMELFLSDIDKMKKGVSYKSTYTYDLHKCKN